MWIPSPAFNRTFVPAVHKKQPSFSRIHFFIMTFHSKIALTALYLGVCLMVYQSNAQTTAAVNKSLADSIRVDPSDILICSLDAKGVQIYKCTQKNGVFSWEFMGPEAKLKDNKGKVVCTHGAGPFWAYQDGSRVEATKIEDSPSTYPNSIPFLLLEGKNHKGKGKFSAVSRIQRVNTKGGLAPKTIPNKSNEGTIVRVDYTATYHFYKPYTK